MKSKITYVISDVNKSYAFEWIIQRFNFDLFDLHFILINRNGSPLENFISTNSIKYDRVEGDSKLKMFIAVLRVWVLLRRNKTSIVHTHLFRASLIGLTAAWLAGIKRRIHTRHHSDYHHRYFPSAVKFDRWINYLSTDVISISQVVSKVLMEDENVSPNKIKLINHGFDIQFIQDSAKIFYPVVKEKYLPEKRFPVIGVISRFTRWKGVQFVIPAFKKLLNDYPDAQLILANAKGDDMDSIKKLLIDIPSNNFRLIEFEENIYSLYLLFDIFTHVPISENVEAFGQVYIEASILGSPSVVTLSGIANQILEDKKNVLVVDYESSESIYHAWKELLQNPDLRNNLALESKKVVRDKFSIERMMNDLNSLYLR